MTQYRIKVNTSRNYRGYFWDFEYFYQAGKKKKEGYWRSARSGYAFTKWGANLSAKKAAKKYLRYEPFESIEELK